jgi:hypothetical protein
MLKARGQNAFFAVPTTRQAAADIWYKRLTGNFGSLFIQLVTVKAIWDRQCSFKAPYDDVAERIFSQTEIDRWSFGVEVLAFARLLRCKIGIMPVDWMNDPKLSAPLQVFWETVEIAWNLSRRKHKLYGAQE